MPEREDVEDECLHSGKHCRPNRCPDCGRFSSHSWTTGWVYSEDGSNEHFGGTCKVHGEWTDAAA